MRITIKTTGTEMLLSVEASTSADFGAALGLVLDRAAARQANLRSRDYWS